MRVVVVDDAPVLRAIVARGIAALGHAVVGEAATLADARTLAVAVLPDVIAVDGRLAGTGDVATLVRTLQAAAPTAAIFVIASLDEAPLVKAARAAGAHGAIKRPILASQLRDVFESVT